MTVAEYARLHGLPWSTAKGRMRGARPRAEWHAAGSPKQRGKRKDLAPEQVARIRAHLAAGEKHEWIALEIGCARCTVTLIANNKRHKRTT